MVIHTIDDGKINGIDYRNCPMIMSCDLNVVTLRFVGDVQPFIQVPLSCIIDSSGNNYESIEAFKTYWNSYHAILQVVVITK